MRSHHKPSDLTAALDMTQEAIVKMGRIHDEALQAQAALRICLSVLKAENRATIMERRWAIRAAEKVLNGKTD